MFVTQTYNMIEKQICLIFETVQARTSGAFVEIGKQQLLETSKTDRPRPLISSKFRHDTRQISYKMFSGGCRTFYLNDDFE